MSSGPSGRAAALFRVSLGSVVAAMHGIRLLVEMGSLIHICEGISGCKGCNSMLMYVVTMI